MADEIAWTALEGSVPVLDGEGREFGEVVRVLGDDASDIFHGLEVRVDGVSDNVEVPADRVTKITTESIRTDLTGEDVAGLRPHLQG